MLDKPEKRTWWDSSHPRRVVAYSFGISAVLAFVIIYPDINTFLEKHTPWQNLLAALPIVVGVLLAFLELKHSDEANEHRAQTVELIGRANDLREKANSLGDENIRLQRETLELQARVHQLQADIEKKLTKVRLYARAHLPNDGMKLLVSNLSEFDLWINRVELIVTEAENAQPGSHILGGATRISSGHSEDGYLLYGTLVSVNGNRTDRFNLKFHIKVLVTGVEDAPVTIHSPKYHFTLMPGKTRELKVLEY